ncbi:MAG: hypothetical protein ACO1RX_12890 [Candidatus Sericytochromatia bacterium]
MSETPPFRDAGQFLRGKRKARGFKTQKALIAALRQIDPDISCSESYISLIEKGVKTPGVHLLDTLAEVLELSTGEKGELLLTYKRVPSDFEFAVRGNLKEAAQETRLDRIRQLYAQEPNREHFNQLLKALILEEETAEAMELLKKAPTFENEVLELQERTAKMASLSGNYDFALQAFELARNNCKNNDELSEILLHIGVIHFQRGLKVQDKDAAQGLEHYLQAHTQFAESLALRPDDAFTLDEHTRCAYHLGDCLLQLARHQRLAKPAAKTHPHLSAAWETWFGKKATLETLQSRSQSYFEIALAGYAALLSAADESLLPDKPMREAVYFHAYSHAKLKLFSTARVLIHSNLILDRNWLTWFMKAGLAVMEYEAEGHSTLLDSALDVLRRACDYDADAVRYLLRLERERELKTLWEARPEAMEALLKEDEDS